MIENIYVPEGQRIGSPENREYTSGAQGLEKAMRNGAILEAVALRCDNDMTLEFDLGGVRGVISKEESAFCPDGERVKDIAVITRVGKSVCFKVLNIINDEKGRTCAVLSRRAAQIQCMNNYLLSLIPGDIIPARVTHMEHFGAFVDIGCGVVSLLPIDSISVSRISHPKDRFDVGMYINAVVRSIDYKTVRIYVSHKELLGTWEENASRFALGQTVAGIVRSIEDYGIFVELAPNLAGLAEYRDGIKPGESASVYIKNIFPERMKIKLVLIGCCENNVENRKEEYFIDCENTNHIARWRYSPNSCERVIESVFE